MVPEKYLSLQTKNVVTVSKSIEAVLKNSLTFAVRTKRVVATNKMDQHSYKAYFVALLRQLNEALEKCNFVRSILEI